MSDKTYVFEQTPNGQMDAATAALLGNRNNGGLFGSNGIEGLIGLIIAAGIFGGGNGNGWFGGGGNNNAEREMLMQAISRNGNDINSLAQQYNCSTGQVMAAINALATQLSTFAGQQGMTSMQIINAIQAGNATLASQLCDCCCKTQSAIQESNYLTERGFCNTNQILAKGFSDIGYETQRQTCDLQKSIQDSTAQILAGQAAIEKRELQREIATLQEEKQTYKLGNMIAAATNPILNEVEALKCKLPKTEVVNVTPDYVPINRGINVNYAPYNCLTGFGFPYGFNNGNGSFF
jgi:hypothetical protein